MKNKSIENIKLFDQNGREIIIKGMFSYGSEENIYLTEEGNAVKIFDINDLPENIEERITALINKALSYHGICIPSGLAYNSDKKFTGYIMPKADVEGQSDLGSFTRSQNMFERKFPGWTRTNLAKLCLNILNKISYLHDNGILIGDVNPSNILVKSDEEVYLINTENYQFDSYPSPAGSFLFTPPELLELDLPSYMREKEHEYYSIAALLFMTLMPGKTPLDYRAGEKPEKTETEAGGDEHGEGPVNGIKWNELSDDLNISFNMVFKGNVRPSVNEWISKLSSYLDELEKGLLPLNIFQQMEKNTLENSSLDINRMDIREGESALRNGVTVFRERADRERIDREGPEKENTEREWNNIAVLELSTKAVKFLSADPEKIRKYGFSFQYFYRYSVKTETGKGLDSNNKMNMTYFKKAVIPSIRKMIQLAKERGIDTLYSVATAAYRTASNREEIIKTIRDSCGINVKILSKEEEAIATLIAFSFSRPPDIEIRNNDRILMIDQGGGSTEISLFSGPDIKFNYSLNLGTTVLRTFFFLKADKGVSLSDALKENDDFIRERLSTFFEDEKAEMLRSPKSDFCISVGTAITNSTGKRGSANQHGTILTLGKLRGEIAAAEALLKRNYSNLSELLAAVEMGDGEKDRYHNQLDNTIIMRLGLPMFVEIMREFDIDEIIVSGTGLWYGIYFEHLLLQ